MVVSLQGSCSQLRIWLLESQSMCSKGCNLFVLSQRLLLGKSLMICPTQYLYVGSKGLYCPLRYKFPLKNPVDHSGHLLLYITHTLTSAAQNQRWWRKNLARKLCQCCAMLTAISHEECGLGQMPSRPSGSKCQISRAASHWLLPPALSVGWERYRSFGLLSLGQGFTKGSVWIATQQCEVAPASLLAQGCTKPCSVGFITLPLESVKNSAFLYSSRHFPAAWPWSLLFR